MILQALENGLTVEFHPLPLRTYTPIGSHLQQQSGAGDNFFRVPLDTSEHLKFPHRTSPPLPFLALILLYSQSSLSPGCPAPPSCWRWRGRTRTLASRCTTCSASPLMPRRPAPPPLLSCKTTPSPPPCRASVGRSQAWRRRHRPAPCCIAQWSSGEKYS